jgi:class 3 adenylate cyclase/cold shock CspA family protein
MTLSDALESAAARVTRIALYAQVAEAASLRAREPESVWLSTYAWFLDTLAENVDHEGTFVKAWGDGALYVFEKDLAAEAINAAILIQEALSAGNVTRKTACTAAIGLSGGELVRFTTLAGSVDYVGGAVDRAVALAGLAMPKAVLVEATTLSATAVGRLRSRAGETKQPPRTPEEYAGKPQRVSVGTLPAALEFQEICWDQPGNAPRYRVPAAAAPTVAAIGAVDESGAMAAGERQSGTVRRWDKKKGQGFIISKEGEFFYVDRRYTAGPPELLPGTKVFFTPRAALIEGKNRVAGCVLALGQSMQGKVVRVGKKGFGFVEVADSCGNAQRLFMFLGDNRDNIGGGDSVSFMVGENDRGPVAQNAARAQPTWRPRHDHDGLREHEHERDQ